MGAGAARVGSEPHARVGVPRQSAGRKEPESVRYLSSDSVP